MQLDESWHNRSGVYKIHCSANEKFYIGSSKNLYRRLWTHVNMLEAGIHDNVHMQRAYEKYGPDTFSISIIEFCTPEKTLLREQYYLDELKSWDGDIGFNIQKEVTAGYPGKSITLVNLETGETKTWSCKKEAAKEIGCAPCSLTLLETEQTRNLVSIKGWALSKVAKYGSGSNNKLKPVTLKHKITGEIRTWNSVKDAQQETRLTTIYHLTTGKCKSAGNWILHG